MMMQAQQVAAAENTRMPGQATESAADAHIAPAPRVSIQAFCETVETAAAVQAAGEDRRLAKAHVKIQMGGIAAATEAYRSSPTPNVILIETDTRTDDVLRGRSVASSRSSAPKAGSALRPWRTMWRGRSAAIFRWNRSWSIWIWPSVRPDSTTIRIRRRA